MKRLEKNKEYSYKEMCVILDIDYEKNKDGSSKKARMKEIECKYKLHKKGTKYLVEEIYARTRKKRDDRENNGGNNTSKYKELDDIILEYCQRNTINEPITPTNLLKKIGVISIQYSSQYFLPIEMKYKFSRHNIDIVHQNIRKMSRNVVSALKRLHRDRLITLVKVAILISPGNENYMTTFSETLRIETIEHEVREEFKREGIKCRYYVLKEKERFYTKVCEKMNEENIFDFFTSYYWAYEIGITEEGRKKIIQTNVDLLSMKMVTSIWNSVCKDHEYRRNCLGEIPNEVQELIELIFVKMKKEYWKNLTSNIL